VRIGLHRIERTGAVWPNTMKDDPRATDGIHTMQTGPYDATRNFLRWRLKRGLQKEQETHATY
jgi:hypothetical protein